MSIVPKALIFVLERPKGLKEVIADKGEDKDNVGDDSAVGLLYDSAQDVPFV
jgi:hypothetical protein